MTPDQRIDLETREQYLFLFESSPDGIVYQDAQGRVLKANPSAERILGLRLKDMQANGLINPHWQAVNSSSEPFPEIQYPWLMALQTAQQVSGVVMGIMHSELGEHRWIKINAIPQFKTGQDRPYQVCSRFEDITETWQVNLERERLLEQLALDHARFEAVLAQMPLGVLVIDAQTKRLSFFNAHIERQLGSILAAGLLVSTINKAKYFVNGQPLLSSAELPLNKALTKGETTLGLEVEIERNDGSRNLVLASAAPIRDSLGRITAAVLTLHDLTEQRHTAIQIQVLTQTIKSATQASEVFGNQQVSKEQFIELMGEMYAQLGQPALEGRLVALLLSNATAISLTQAAKLLAVSKVAVSKISNAMLERGDLSISRAFSSRQHLLALTDQHYIRDLVSRRAASWTISILCDRVLETNPNLETEAIKHLQTHLETHARLALNLEQLLSPIERSQARARLEHLRDNWDAVEPKRKKQPEV